MQEAAVQLREVLRLLADRHSSVLDEAALASVDQAAPFPPIPWETSAGPLALMVPFD
jgi:hypothetical protein